MRPEAETAVQTEVAIAPRWCRDFDEDCHDVPDKAHCSRLDPDQGTCVYLCGEARP